MMSATGAPAARARARGLGHGLLTLLIALATIATFLPALSNGFVGWDDTKSLVDNPHYRGLGWAQLKWMFTTFHMGLYMPLSWLTLGLDSLVWGMNPLGYHLTSVLLHAATAIAFYFLGLRLLRLALPSAAEWDLRLGAVAAALFWAVHPLRIESVAWASERRDVLSGLFYVSAVIAYLKAAAAGGRRPGRWYWASVGLFVGALLSKSITVTLPVALLALDAYPLRRLGPGRWLDRRVWLEKLPFLALAATAAVLAFVANSYIGNRASWQELGLLPRLVLTAHGLAFYMLKTLLPLNLSPFYPLDLHVTWMHFGFVIGATVLAVALARQWPAFTAVWIVYVATLFPVLGFFQNGPQAAADRYTYLSSMGWSLLAGAMVAWRWAGSSVLRTVVVLWLCALAWLSWQQTEVWRDSITLWTQAVRVNSQSRAAHFNLAEAYEHAGHYAEALAEYEEVRRLSPRQPRWYVPIGRMYERIAAEQTALAMYARALAGEPGLPEACEAARRLADRLKVSPPELATCPTGRS
jgi:tetratricopeptide (TPR) repeat protein